MFDRRHRGLDNEDIAAGLFGDYRELFGILRDTTDNGGDFMRFDLLDPLGDQFFLDRLQIYALNKFRGFFRAGLGDRF